MNVILMNVKSQAFVALLGTFANLRKTTVSSVMSFLYNSYKSTWNKSAHTIRNFMKFSLRNNSIIWLENICLC